MEDNLEVLMQDLYEKCKSASFNVSVELIRMEPQFHVSLLIKSMDDSVRFGPNGHGNSYRSAFINSLENLKKSIDSKMNHDFTTIGELKKITLLVAKLQ